MDAKNFVMVSAKQEEWNFIIKCLRAYKED